jgi:hypothetical protein
MRTAVILAVALAGCTFPTKPGDPFACDGDPLPMTAPLTIHVHVFVQDPILGNSVTATIKETIEGVTATGQTDASGNYDAELMTLGLPRPAILESDPDNSAMYLPTIAYPPLPIASDQNVAIYQFQKTAFKDPTSGDPIDPSTVTFSIVAVTDCNGKPVGGATVSAKVPGGADAGQIFYVSAQFGNIDVNAHVTDAVTGAAFVVGAPDVTAVTVGASLDGVTFQSNNVTVKSNAVTLVEVSP